MSDVNGAADAAAESVSAPAADAPVADTPNPVATEDQGHPEPDKPAKDEKPAKAEAKADKPITTREALEKAAAKVEKDNTPEKDKPAPVKSEGPTRDETGKFAAKEGDKEVVRSGTRELTGKEAEDAKAAMAAAPKPTTPAHEAPARFSPDAKAAWATTHDSVKAETHRAIKEMEAGIEKHRASSEAFESYRDLDNIAKQHGKQGAQVFREYYQMEQLLQKDLVGGLNEICSRVGVSLKDVAAHVMGQTPDQNASVQDATIRELKGEIASLKQQVGSVSQTFQEQRHNAVLQDVQKFAQENPRFEELSEDIAFFMKSGRAKDLSEAYTLAERLNPATAAASALTPAASSAPAIDLSVQTDKGQKSITGSPSPGSDPVRRQPSPSIKDALRRAVAQAG